jgi:hypothetical protein
MSASGRDERARQREAARRSLAFGETEPLPMTPVRPISEDLDTPEKIAKAADEYLIEKNLSVLSSVHSMQSTLGKRWTLSGREPDKRTVEVVQRSAENNFPQSPRLFPTNSQPDPKRDCALTGCQQPPIHGPPAANHGYCPHHH